MHYYLEKTENAAEELFSIYEAVKGSWGDYALQVGQHKQLVKNFKDKLNNPNLNDTEKNELKELLISTETRLENYITETQIYDTTMRILAGSILQLAKQGLSTVFGVASNVPTEPQIAGIPVAKIIVAGRNQSLHHEEGHYNNNVYNCFQALEQINPNLSLQTFPEKNMSKDVLDILEWDNYESYLVTMEQLFNEAS